MRISGNTVLITGGSAGIGLATAVAIKDAGNEVIICGRDEDRLRNAREKAPGMHTIRCDLTRDGEIERLVAVLRQDFPELDILINNAGVLHTNDFIAGDGSYRWIEEEVRLNLVAPLTLTKLLLPILQEQEASAVVIVSSGLALAPLASAPVYSATKAALHSFSRALRHSLTGTSVKLFEVLPPWVETDLARSVAGAKLTPEAVARSIVQGLEHDRLEIRIGQIKSLNLLSRLAPFVAERVLNRSAAG